ncbi:MATE family efflux transporter [Jutongia hominis]|uniref:Probable multidrug resistance protein NorM n=1 Tax=Jutongia hominis TaxID=2763664 RepID=A0ABR7MW07_9FIRM|nr:MATE family efflux transporter [Jutongia hominis]
MKDLTKGKILPLLLGFAVPIAVGNIFQLFYSLADTRIVGSFLGEEALAAVGATSSLNNMIIGFLLGMTNGFAIIVARYFGAKDHDNLKRAVAATFILGIGMAFIFTIVSVSLLRFILVGLQTPKNLLDLSVEYFRIILFGMTGAMLYNVCAGLFRAIGDSLTPLLFLIASTFVNIGLDLLFVCVFHLGVAGAAWATILSQYGSFACCFIYMRKRYDILLFGKKDCHLKRDMVKEMLSIGFSMGFMNSLINIGSVALQGAINSLQDTNYIVAHTAARKITEVFMLPFSVFGTTMATFCGQNLGAGKNDRIKKGLWQVIWITWAWCAGMIILAYTVAPVLVHLITDTTQVKVIATASLYLRMNTILYFIPAVICILRNAMQGIGDSITPVISSSLELLCKVLVAVFLTPYLGYWAIIWSEPISWVIMVIPLLIRIANNPVLKGNQTN